MNINLGLRAVALVLVVAACTVVLAAPELIGGAKAANAPELMALLALGRN